jgi:cellobiose phosphorylase
VLGFRLRGARLGVDPCIPRGWPGFSLTFRWRSARYDIVVENPHGVSRGVVTIELDGLVLDAARDVALADDGTTHRLRLRLG